MNKSYNEAWRRGFFAGLEKTRNKETSSRLSIEEKEKIKDELIIFIDAKENIYSSDIDKCYGYSTFWGKIRCFFANGKVYSEQEIEEELYIDRLILSFLAFLRSVGLDAFLEYLELSTFCEDFLISGLKKESEDKPSEEAQKV